jgi:uncharacterized DUF497 family protein
MIGMVSRVNYNFIWDNNKAGANLKKHGISFERAATVFNDPYALTIFDKDHSENESRWITLGMDAGGILIVVCHTFDESLKADTQLRIYSARKATKNEKNQYEGT